MTEVSPLEMFYPNGRRIKSVSTAPPFVTYLEDDEELPVVKGYTEIRVKSEPERLPYPTEVTWTGYLTSKQRNQVKRKNQMARQSRKRNKR